MDVRTSESKGVYTYNTAADRNRFVDNLNSTIGKGWYVRVWTTEVQVGSPDSSLQRKQHLCEAESRFQKLKSNRSHLFSLMYNQEMAKCKLYQKNLSISSLISETEGSLNILELNSFFFWLFFFTVFVKKKKAI